MIHTQAISMIPAEPGTRLVVVWKPTDHDTVEEAETEETPFEVDPVLGWVLLQHENNIEETSRPVVRPVVLDDGVPEIAQRWDEILQPNEELSKARVLGLRKTYVWKVKRKLRRAS
jgi:hypothetical protein